MTSQRVTVLELTDIESASIECATENCGTRVTMILGNRKSVPEACPICNISFDKNLRDRLADLLEFYLKLETTPVPIRLQIRQETEKGTNRE